MIERRGKPRVTLAETVRYRLCDGASDLLAGVGKTVDVSASGMLLRVQDDFQVGTCIAVTVGLPSPDESVRVQTTLLGHVVRVEPGSIAIQFEDQELGGLLYEAHKS